MTHFPDRMVRLTLPLSVLVHGGLLTAVLLFAAPPVLAPVPMRVIVVDFVHPEPPPPAAPVANRPPSLPAANSKAEATAKTGIDADGMVAATEFYAAGILSDPANAEVRDNFPLLATSEQVTQLCNMEALEQLRIATPSLPADVLVGYAFDSITIDGNVLNAPGGAVRSGGQWFHFRYRCVVAADIANVSAFEYALGALVPPGQWEEHFLNADDDGLN